MITRAQLYEAPEYWMERIQNDLYRELQAYKEREKLNQTQLAEKLGFTKGYISQVLNGNFNYSLRKLIDLSLAIGVVPDVEFRDLAEFIDCEDRRLDNFINYGFVKIDIMPLPQFVNINANEETSKQVA